MTETNKAARIAGFLYLLLVFLGPVRLIYIPSVLFVTGNATATSNNIASHELLFRFGIVCDLLGGVVLIFLTLAFYRLFETVDRRCAVLVVILGGILPAAMYFLNDANDGAALILVRGGDFLSAFDTAQRYDLAMFFVKLHFQVVLGAEILWGLWLFPLAILVYKSGFLPRFIGIWLTINGFAYLVLSFTGLLLPNFYDILSTYAFPAQLGEIALVLWLLIVGAKTQRRPQPASP